MRYWCEPCLNPSSCQTFTLSAHLSRSYLQPYRHTNPQKWVLIWEIWAGIQRCLCDAVSPRPRGPCFNYRKPIWLRRYLCLIYSMSYQTIKTLDSFLTSPEILLIYSIICTSRVNILPSGLFFPPSVVSGGDERIPRLRADTCSGAVVMSAPVSLWSFGLENRKPRKPSRLQGPWSLCDETSSRFDASRRFVSDTAVGLF